MCRQTHLEEAGPPWWLQGPPSLGSGVLGKDLSRQAGKGSGTIRPSCPHPSGCWLVCARVPRPAQRPRESPLTKPSPSQGTWGPQAPEPLPWGAARGRGTPRGSPLSRPGVCSKTWRRSEVTLTPALPAASAGAEAAGSRGSGGAGPPTRRPRPAGQPRLPWPRGSQVPKPHPAQRLSRKRCKMFP